MSNECHELTGYKISPIITGIKQSPIIYGWKQSPIVQGVGCADDFNNFPFLLLETGDFVLLETGFKIYLES